MFYPNTPILLLEESQAFTTSAEGVFLAKADQGKAAEAHHPLGRLMQY